MIDQGRCDGTSDQSGRMATRHPRQEMAKELRGPIYDPEKRA